MGDMKDEWFRSEGKDTNNSERYGVALTIRAPLGLVWGIKRGIDV